MKHITAFGTVTHIKHYPIGLSPYWHTYLMSRVKSCQQRQVSRAMISTLISGSPDWNSTGRTGMRGLLIFRRRNRFFRNPVFVNWTVLCTYIFGLPRLDPIFQKEVFLPLPPFILSFLLFLPLSFPLHIFSFRLFFIFVCFSPFYLSINLYFLMAFLLLLLLLFLLIYSYFCTAYSSNASLV